MFQHKKIAFLLVAALLVFSSGTFATPAMKESKERAVCSFSGNGFSSPALVLPGISWPEAVTSNITPATASFYKKIGGYKAFAGISIFTLVRPVSGYCTCPYFCWCKESHLESILFPAHFFW